MPVLATKLHVPEPRADLVSRPRLQHRLGALDHSTRLVLICAPAGFGKTTILSQWLSGTEDEDRARRIAWLGLDAADNDIRRFLLHVIAAFRRTNAEVGVEAQGVLDATEAVPAEQVLTSLINDLDLLADETVLALDDYHEIITPDIHDLLAFLLDHLPRHVSIAITTRSDPPLPLARLRSNRGLIELRAADLRFTFEETAVLFNQVMDLDLAPGLLGTLDERTEGWVAGLQLAALSLRGREDPAAFVDDFAGSHRFVLDYLVEEVLDRQPDRVREFLLATSVLRELSGSLCEAVTGMADAQEILESLDRDNVFVIPLDDARCWYRYHHLFADALRARLLARQPDRLRGLHTTAGRWLAERGMFPDAVTHAIAGEDHELTADLVELALAGLRRGRQDATILAWLAAVPDEVVRRRPLLATATAWSRLAAGDFEGVEAWLDVAQDGLAAGSAPPGVSTPAPQEVVEAHAQEMRALSAMIAVYRASVAQARGDVAGTIAHAQRAYDLAGPEDHFSRGAGAGFLGLAAWADGDLQTAVETFTDAVVSLRAAGLVADALGSTVVLGSMCLARGRPLEARWIFDEALATAERRGGPALPTVGDVHVGLADVLRELGDLDGAARHLDVARELVDLASLPENRHRWYTTTAGVLRARGDLHGAVAMLDEAEPLFRPGFFPEVRPIAAARARALLAQGNVIEARAWARQHAVEPGDGQTYLEEYDQLTLARVLIAERTPADAIALVDPIVESARASGRDGSLIEAHMVRALAHHAAGDPRVAAEELSIALTIGVPAGYRRLFLDEGPAMGELLTSLVRGAPADVRRYAEQVLASAMAQTTRLLDQHPDEALSERELDVLRLLATDLTGPEIAGQLYVSLNTLRTHTKHIFTKLGVNTRRAAVSRAANLGLL